MFKSCPVQTDNNLIAGGRQEYLLALVVDALMSQLAHIFFGYKLVYHLCKLKGFVHTKRLKIRLGYSPSCRLKDHTTKKLMLQKVCLSLCLKSTCCQ